jgi:hypothetical protein
VPDRVDGCVELDLDGQMWELDVLTALRCVAREQAGREVSARDLAGRHHRACVAISPRPGAAGDPFAHEAVVATADQHAAEHRAKWLGVDRHSNRGRDGLGDGVRLLGREPALLDGERRRISGRVDALDADKAPGEIDGDEPTRRCQPAGRGCDAPRASAG